MQAMPCAWILAMKDTRQQYSQDIESTAVSSGKNVAWPGRVADKSTPTILGTEAGSSAGATLRRGSVPARRRYQAAYLFAGLGRLNI